MSADQIPTLCASLRSLALAARIQHRQDHQVRQRKQPLIGLLLRCLIHACDKAEVPPARQTVEMLQADPRQGGNLRVRKDLLARLDLDHAFALNLPSSPDSERAPEGAKSFLIFRSEHNPLNDFANLANPLACRSVRLKFEVRVQVLKLPRILAPAPVNVRQHKVSQGKTGLPQESLSSTSLCILKAIQTKKGNTQEEMTCGCTPIHVQSFADNSLCFGVFPLSAKQQTKGELCPGVVPSAQINRFLESLCGVLFATEPEIRQTHVVVRFVIVRECCGSSHELRPAADRIILCQALQSLFERIVRVHRYSQFPHRNRVICPPHRRKVAGGLEIKL